MIRFFLGLCLFLVTVIFLGNIGIIWWANKYGTEVNHEDTVNMAKGMVYLMNEEMGRLAPEKRLDHVSRIQDEFGFPIAIQAWDAFQASNEEKQRLLGGKILITPRSIEEFESIHFRMADSGQVVSMGPVTNTPEMDRLVQITDLLSNAVIILGLFSWVLFLRFRLQKLHKAAEALGDGDLTARAGISSGDLIGQLGRSFNGMADRIQRLLEGHRELINAVSHELRTPIARLSFEMEMLRECDTDEDRKRFIDGMVEDVAELDGLVEELLSYARLDRMPPMEPHPHLLAVWLAEEAAGFRVPDPVSVEVRVPQELREMEVPFDPSFLGRALSNLLVNAGRYGASLVRVSLEKTRGAFLIHVDDDGPGIARDKREEIFQPFVRLETSRNRETGGTGLGLAIVAQIMTRHKGRVCVEDSPLGGARFTLSLPR